MGLLPRYCVAAAPFEIVHSAPGLKPNDDAFGVAFARDAFHVWVIDGATSVSDVPCKVVPYLSDAGWFARALSQEIRRRLRFGELTEDALARSLAHLHARFEAGAGPGLEPHDYPVAAMTYLRVVRVGAAFEVRSLDFADCFHAIVARPGTMRGLSCTLPLRLPDRGLPKSGPELDRLRARRAAQVKDLASTAITTDPTSVGMGAWSRAVAQSGDVLIVGSDGYARL